MTSYQVVIAGGGISGLVSAICLSKAGLQVCLVERKKYPFHRVCGEYISDEVTPFLKSMDAFPRAYNPPRINRFKLTSVNGNMAKCDLDLGGFGISRYSFDEFLAQKASDIGAVIFTGKIVDDIRFSEDRFMVVLSDGSEIHTEIVIGAFGKRSNLDRKLNRPFIFRSSPYIGVKYHIRLDVPEHEIALHNFKGGYCGISKVENNVTNLCYLSERRNLKKTGDIGTLEREVLHRNPFLKKIWHEAEFLFSNPVVINEINFESKKPVESHILMAGDAAGMITPLCGNGMAIAIHSAKIVSEEVIGYFNAGHPSRKKLEENYSRRWKRQFSTRLMVGRRLQKLFGSNFVSNLSVGVLNHFTGLGNFLISKTHGKPF